jgi:DNA-binding MarR family transcriptional regulator
MSSIDRPLGQNISILAQVIADVCQPHTLDQASNGALSSNQYKVLKIVANRQDFAVGEIARMLHVSPAAASKIIERLVQMGMVSRSPLPGDRRRIHLELLGEGKVLLHRYDTIAEGKLGTMLSHFEEGEKEVLLDLLRRVIQHILADERDAELVCLQCAGECGEECVISQSQGTCSAKTRP